MKDALKAIQNNCTGAALPHASAAELLTARREEMVEKQIRRRGVTSAAVLEAIRRVPRHEFVLQEDRQAAYDDQPLPIGGGQTISQPYIVASMTAALRLTGAERVLEIGTGCGYQAAVLSHLATEVFTIERHASLANAASQRLPTLGYTNVHVHCGDGSLGLPEFAPYDAILVAAAAPQLPPPLLQQLADGGRLILPVGSGEHQHLELIHRQGSSFVAKALEACRFVPLIGYYGVQESSER
jgi:protein-L-isoaspartate(D-aspartate) O-methyltransferase